MASTWTDELDQWLTTEAELGERVAGAQYADDIIDTSALLASRVRGDQFIVDVKLVT